MASSVVPNLLTRKNRFIPIVLLLVLLSSEGWAGPGEFQSACAQIQKDIAADAGLVPENRPILLTKGKPTAKAVLILHGFSASPYETAPLARALHSAGFNVYVPRLAFHGQGREVFDTLDRKLWLESARRALELARPLGQRIYLLGHSGGGALACLVASEDPHSLAGLVLAAPALRLRDWRAPYSFFPPVRWLFPKVHFEAEQAGDERYWNLDYSSHTAYQLVRTGWEASKALKKLNLPVLMLQADQDPLVNGAYNQKHFAKIPGSPKELLVYHSNRHNVLMRHPQAAQVAGWVEGFMDENP
jgi:carboxylesterase